MTKSINARRRRPAVRHSIFFAWTGLLGILQHPCGAYVVRPTAFHDKTSTLWSTRDDSDAVEMERSIGTVSRRDSFKMAAAAVSLLPLSAAARTSTKSLEDMALGDAVWIQTSDSTGTSPSFVPATFATYAARILIRYDEGVASWWKQLEQTSSLLTTDRRTATLDREFGSFALSVQMAVEDFLISSNDGYEPLARLFLDRYGHQPDAKRQVALLFALLPDDQQPTNLLSQLATKTLEKGVLQTLNEVPNWLEQDPTALLPEDYQVARIADSPQIRIDPALRLYQRDPELGPTTTAFGPLSSALLPRELPTFSPNIYALFGISGATGCALTHAIVIPLDVVKTRAQTDPDEYKNVFKGALRILQEEGVEGLLLGAQATVAGYAWYGLSVYPSYTFFKRFIALGLLPPEVAAIQADNIALLAGALAAVIASLGLTPLEAARIRAVAEPQTYKPLGLTGTLAAIAKEDVGWRALYAGLPSLLTRQVIFGSVKFLAFERACEAIYAVWPFLRDATWTALTVSLVAGGFSGALSSVVSQPADSVLTYVAQNSKGTSSLGVIEGCRVMIENEGVGSLFRGLGSRCVWAGSIIAGQFLLYDVFRTYFGVSGNDLSQVFQVTIPVQTLVI